jgi:hypothetical protein
MAERDLIVIKKIFTSYFNLSNNPSFGGGLGRLKPACCSTGLLRKQAAIMFLITVQ